MWVPIRLSLLPAINSLASLSQPGSEDPAGPCGGEKQTGLCRPAGFCLWATVFVIIACLPCVLAMCLIPLEKFTSEVLCIPSKYTWGMQLPPSVKWGHRGKGSPREVAEAASPESWSEPGKPDPGAHSPYRHSGTAFSPGRWVLSLPRDPETVPIISM